MRSSATSTSATGSRCPSSRRRTAGPLRVSIQGYNDDADADALIEALT